MPRAVGQAVLQATVIRVSEEEVGEENIDAHVNPFDELHKDSSSLDFPPTSPISLGLSPPSLSLPLSHYVPQVKFHSHEEKKPFSSFLLY